MVRAYARKGVFWASQKTIAQALKNQYRLITPSVVARLIKQDSTLMRIAGHRQMTHGVVYLVLSIPSRSSTARRKAVALKMIQRLVEKHKKNMNDPHVPEESARYGREYRHKRAFWTGKLIFGSLSCTRCGKTVVHGQRLHLDHVDGSDTLIAGWAHPWCNRRHQLKARLASWFRPNMMMPGVA